MKYLSFREKVGTWAQLTDYMSVPVGNDDSLDRGEGRSRQTYSQRIPKTV